MGYNYSIRGHCFAVFLLSGSDIPTLSMSSQWSQPKQEGGRAIALSRPLRSLISFVVLSVLYISFSSLKYQSSPTLGLIPEDDSPFRPYHSFTHPRRPRCSYLGRRNFFRRKFPPKISRPLTAPGSFRMTFQPHNQGRSMRQSLLSRLYEKITSSFNFPSQVQNGGQ